MSWQLALTLLCVGAAILFVARRLWAFARTNTSGGCGPSGCGHCPTSGAAANLGKARAFVSLETMESSRGKNAGAQGSQVR
jgi:hypothetical protein